MPFQTITCMCGKTVGYDNPSVGATNVGHFQRQTGWKLVNETFHGRAFPTCPECRLKAQVAARIIKEMYGTLYISLNSI